jgi:methylthioribose-1-phosphate isomerase
MALAYLAGEDMETAAQEIKNARPTAVNLFWAVDRVFNSENPVEEAENMYWEDVNTNKKLGRYGSEVIKDGDTILTHCNAGALACVDYGTALGVIRSAVEQNKNIQVICDETRPVLQGARLSVWEMQKEGIPVKLIVDGAAGRLMQEGKIDKVIIGADRVAKGGIANKIGSLMVALAAQRFKVPFYVAAPKSTFDYQNHIEDIEIEERDPEEVLSFLGCRAAPAGTEVRNPSFDVVPKDLITGIITEEGILDPW